VGLAVLALAPIELVITISCFYVEGACSRAL
jgi:hypothetical protein